jgi:hypothetical protein
VVEPEVAPAAIPASRAAASSSARDAPHRHHGIAHVLVDPTAEVGDHDVEPLPEQVHETGEQLRIIVADRDVNPPMSANSTVTCRRRDPSRASIRRRNAAIAASTTSSLREG